MKLAPRSASASVSSLLCDSTTRAAIAFAARHAAAGGALSAPAAALAQEVLKSMLIHKLRLAAISLFVLAAVATGAGWLARSMAIQEDPARDPAARACELCAARRDSPERRRSPISAPAGRMTVTGRVLDPDGKPVQGAVVDLMARPRMPLTGAREDMEPHTLLGQGRSDADGRFRLDAARTASTRVFEVHAIARAAGYGLGWAALNPDADQPAADVKLLPEQPVRVRLVDVTGAPARGAEIRVESIGRPDNGLLDGVIVWTNPPEGMRTWPRPVKTDDQGKATVPGIGRGLSVLLTVMDSRYARQDLRVPTSQPASDRETTLALQPGKIIEGRVLADDTGRPIPNAVIAIAAGEQAARLQVHDPVPRR